MELAVWKWPGPALSSDFQAPSVWRGWLGTCHLLLALQTFCRHTHTSFWSLFIALVLPCAPQPPPAAGTQMQGYCWLSCEHEAVSVSSISSSVIGTVTSGLFEDH